MFAPGPLTCLVLLLFAPVALRAQETALPAAGDVITRYITAIGGEAMLRKLTSRRIIAELEMPAQGIKGSMEIIAAAPNRLVARTTIPGVGTNETGYDGEVAWSNTTMGGASLLEGRQKEQTQASAEFLLPLHQNVRALRVLDRRELEGATVYAIEVAPQAGRPSVEYFDVASGLLVGSEQHISTPGGDVPTTTLVSDYRDVDGIRLPMRMIQRLPGGQVLVTRVTRVEHGTVDPSEFALPPAVRALVKKDQR